VAVGRDLLGSLVAVETSAVTSSAAAITAALAVSSGSEQ
jgi:hypothetical protein